MSSPISRRVAMEALGAIAVGAGATEIGCSNQRPKPEPTAQEATARVAAVAPSPCGYPSPPGIVTGKPHVNLICHGMMLFWYDQSTSVSKNYINILIPQPPMMKDTSGSGMHYGHVISLTDSLGTAANRLVDAGGNYVPGEYDLSISSGTPYTASSSSWRGPNATEDVVMNNASYPLMLNSDFSCGASHSLNDKIWFLIRVPYPTWVFRYSIIDLQGYPPYASGKTVKAFQIKPTTIGGTHVFYYQNASDWSLNRPCGGGSGPATKVGSYVNLHLYSQPAVAADYGNVADYGMHLPVFDAMVKYDSQTALDLSGPSTVYEPGCLPSYPIDADLGYSAATTPYPPALQDLVDLGKAERNRTGEPVECLQGWGS